MLTEITTSSFVLGVDNRAKQRVPLLGNIVSGNKGSLEVLKKPPQNPVVHGSSEDQRDVRRGFIGVVEKLDLQSNHLLEEDSWCFEGGMTGDKEGFSSWPCKETFWS